MGGLFKAGTLKKSFRANQRGRTRRRRRVKRFQQDSRRPAGRIRVQVIKGILHGNPNTVNGGWALLVVVGELPGWAREPRTGMRVLLSREEGWVGAQCTLVAVMGITGDCGNGKGR